MKRTYLVVNVFLALVCCISVSRCRKPFEPDVKATDINTLVVDGFIDGASPVAITMSRARRVTAGDTAARKPELHAQVLIEDDHQNSYPLPETGNGMYNSGSRLNLDPSYQYRLHIITTDGKDYVSDFVPFKSAPPIDSVSWLLKNEGVQISLNTHDPTNSSRYYFWTYKETWEFRAWFRSLLEYDSPLNIVKPRTELVLTCWRSDSNTNILLGNTVKLNRDTVDQAPITFIAYHDKRISVRYSILVRQYALDVKAYNYWLGIKNNSETTGSIFDPQPNQTTGNIHCTSDQAERVVGYVSAGNSSEKRIFIDNTSMPNDWNVADICPLRVVPNIPDSLKFYFRAGLGPIVEVVNNGVVTGYQSSYKVCVDCTVLGTTKKPSFW